ncbi:phytanoyl-CoA dioxygenase family protein [Sphingobium fuliginis]|uniref:Phytanoyl-CoA dioxygenase family protein n=1 Tax=Sphingobium fuliginis ATCC 27551 TaxID=1208342 RepID=A0A5B8CG49_SPHSA|nr:phytanoyl-CoA dioxygenase family protein [Sphingobium fuliginis]QDC37236.1 phytanoyl-CoA dioxygenase family protein [Sphingobium fuliginis ATCC 27551]
MAQDSTLLTARLLADGYCIIRGACADETIASLDRQFAQRFEKTPFCEGGFYGARTKRFGALLRRAPEAASLVQHALVLRIVEAVLGAWCDRIVLNLTQAVELHPQALAQIPHRDQDLWNVSRDGREYQVNVIWPLTPFTADNGATLLWPESQRPEAPAEPIGEAIAAEMAAGDALLFLGSLLHGGGANTTDHARRSIIISYCLGWLRTFENQYLVYPPEIARSFGPELAALVGYAQHRPNLGNVEGQCPSILLGRDEIDGLAALDALRPDQAEALAVYVAEQEAARAGLIGG